MPANHVILCGLGRIGRRVLEFLEAAGVAVVAIDTMVTPAEQAATGTVRYLCGDFRSRAVLEQAGLAEARGVFILTSDDLVNLSTLMHVLHARPGLRAVVRMFNPALVARLGSVASHTFALSTSALTAPLLALIAHTSGELACFELDDGQPMIVSEWQVPAQHPLVGQRLAEVERLENLDTVAHAPPHGPRCFIADCDGDAVLAAGDSLVVCGPADVVQRVTGVLESSAVADRGGWDKLRRLARVGRKLLLEVELPVKICATILIAVIVSSVILFRFGMKNDTIVDAFYRTISLMATGADMRGQDAEPGSWQKAFISGLRLVGAALTAAFTAILTNYLVRAQLGGALEVHRIPERGHVIVTGLGNISFRALQELRRLDEEVVAIERNRSNTFISPARQLGAAVIIGDALVDEVLKQAHAGTAKAVVVATDDELVNLEIALLVRELHPHKRLLVRLIDPKLAELLREAANIHLALSIPELAAPAFLAAFIGDRIRAAFVAYGKLVAVVDIVIHEHDRLVDQPIAAWSAEYRLLPVAVTSGATQFVHARSPQLLKAGSLLTALVTFHDIPRLFQRGEGGFA